VNCYQDNLRTARIKFEVALSGDASCLTATEIMQYAAVLMSSPRHWPRYASKAKAKLGEDYMLWEQGVVKEYEGMSQRHEVPKPKKEKSGRTVGGFPLIQMRNDEIDENLLLRSGAILQEVIAHPDRAMEPEAILAAAIDLGQPDGSDQVPVIHERLRVQNPQLIEKWEQGIRKEQKSLMREGVIPRRLVLKSHADRLRESLAPPLEVIAGLMPVGCVGAIISEPGVGKSLLLAEIARCVAGGTPFAGRKTLKGRVLYVCPDSPKSTERRLLAVGEVIGGDIPSLDDCVLPSDIDLLRKEVESAAAKGESYRLILIDTYDAARMHDGDGTYSAQDAAVESILGPLRRMCDDLGVSLVFSHHSTRADNGRPRGSMVFDARVEMWGVVNSVADKTINFFVKKNRDGESNFVLGTWKIGPKVIGGHPVATLVEITTPTKASGNPQDQVVLKVLAARAKPAGVRQPTQKALSAEADLSSSTFQRVLERLRIKGLVQTGSYELTEGGQSRLREIGQG